ncbi:MAG: lipopolysaccharide biosynthesis protein [Sedimentisphaerales bacterium]
MFRNTSVLLGGRTIAGLMAILSLSIAARALGPEGLGVFALIQAYVIIIDRLLNFQCWQAVIKFGADFLKQNKPEEFKSLVKFCTILDAATALCGAVIAAAGVYFFGNWKGWQQQTIYATIVYCIWILFNLEGTAGGLLRLFDKFKLVSATNITGATLKLVFAALGYAFSPKLMTFVIIWVTAGIAETILLLLTAWYQVYKRTGDNFFKAKLGIAAKDKTLWKFVLSTNLNQSVKLASRELDVLIVGAVLGTAATGIYKIARQLAAIPAMLIEPMYQAVYTELAALAAEKRFSDLKHIIAKTTVIGGVASLLIWLFFVIFAGPILNVLAGANFEQARGVMIVYMFAFVIWGLSFCLPAGLLALGKATICLIILIIVQLIFLPALYLLLKNAGIIGAGIAQVIFFAVYSVLMFIFFTKNLSKEMIINDRR